MDAPLTSPFFAVSNGLAGEKSPYLRQHAQNPVQWLPWGNEAFERARSQNKPIFLSIGYSTCHWCHVMARESFENPQIAALMNELFVNVKVDREERPDVDRVYMAFVQATTGSGGWPMSVWLTPDLKPIFGGTYFPPADRYGRRGFPAVCRALAEAWRTDRDKLSAQSERVIEALRDAGANDREPSVVGDLPRVDAVLWREALGPYLDGFDTEWGGFGGSPKFPRPVVLQLLARIVYRLERAGARQEADQARDALLLTLDKMAAGGIHDHLGGGFSRYSVDRYWHVPHFEKMLYDQAQLVFAYLEAYQLTRHETYRSVVYDILGYVQRDLTSEAGGFFSAEDADSSVSFEHPAEHAEGAFYVWSAAEINAALTAEESVTFCRIYGVDQEGNCPPESDPHGEFRGKNVLIQRESIPSADAPVIDAARRKLLAARAGRPRPHLDDKVLAAWNGLMISAYARAYRIFDEPSFLQSAQRAASFIRTEMFSETSGVLRRSFREGPAKVDGFADDYAFLIQGLLDLYEADFDLEHLLWARRLQQTQDALFFDRENGGYYGAVAAPSVSASSEPSLPLRLKEDHDGAEPSSSSVSAVNLGRLSAVLGDVTLRAQALQTVATFVRADRQDEAPTISRLAQTLPAMLTAWDVLAQEPERIVIAGSIDEPRTALFSKAASQPYAPGRVLMLADGGRGQELLAVGAPYLAAISLIDGKPAAYRCADGTCQLPTTNPADLSAP